MTPTHSTRAWRQTTTSIGRFLWVQTACMPRLRSAKTISMAPFLGTFAQLRKATISFLMPASMSVHPFVRLEHTGRIFIKWYISIFRKSITNIQEALKSDKNNGYFVRNPVNIDGSISPNSSFQARVVEKITRHILCQTTFRNREKIRYSHPRHRGQYGACALHAGYLRLDTHSDCVILIAFPRQKRLRKPPWR